MDLAEGNGQNSRREFIKKAALTGFGTAIIPEFLLPGSLPENKKTESSESYLKKPWTCTHRCTLEY